MSEPSEAAKAKLLELAPPGEAVRPIFASFIQQVSDAAKNVSSYTSERETRQALSPFILPEPVDPLWEALHEVFGATVGLGQHVPAMREALAKRGLKIVERDL